MKDLVMTSERRSGIDMYAELQRIKYAEDRDREIDIAMKNCEAKLRVWGIEPEILRI